MKENKSCLDLKFKRRTSEDAAETIHFAQDPHQDLFFIIAHPSYPGLQVRRRFTPKSNLNLVYDGECGLCIALVRWVKNRDRSARINPVPYQDGRELERLGLSPEEAQRQVYVVEAGRGKRGGAAAINRILEVLGGPWGMVARAYTLRPVAFLEERLYHWVSRNRRWIGNAKS